MNQQAVEISVQSHGQKELLDIHKRTSRKENVAYRNIGTSQYTPVHTQDSGG